MLKYSHDSRHTVTAHKHTVTAHRHRHTHTDLHTSARRSMGPEAAPSLAFITETQLVKHRLD